MSLKDHAAGGYGRTKEYVKIALRSGLHKRNLGLVRNPYSARVATALRWMGTTTVLDVGANIGQYGSALRSSGFDGRLISCEPLTDAYSRLARRAGSDDRWMALHTAVGDTVGTLEINVAANSYSSSVLVMTNAHLDAAPGSQTIGQQQVAVTTVAELVAGNKIDPGRTLLKVDTQGYESHVLDGAGALLRQFASIQLELSFVPLYAGQQLFGALMDRLDSSGYDIYTLKPGFADPRTGRTLQCDALFVRRDLMPDPGDLGAGPG